MMHSSILHAWRENECNSIKKLVKMKKKSSRCDWKTRGTPIMFFWLRIPNFFQSEKLILGGCSAAIASNFWACHLLKISLEKHIFEAKGWCGDVKSIVIIAHGFIYYSWNLIYWEFEVYWNLTSYNCVL